MSFRKTSVTTDYAYEVGRVGRVIHLTGFCPHSSGGAFVRAASYLIVARMDWSVWTAPASTLLGAGLALVGGWLAVRQRDRADQRALSRQQREEWTRRFEMALTRLSDASDARVRSLGRAALEILIGSELATDEDRMLAAAAVEYDLQSPQRPSQQGIAPDVDKSDAARHTERSDEGGGGR